MKTTKRILAVVLAVMMVVAMVPVITVSAATTVTDNAGFVAAVANGGEIVIGSDFTLTDEVDVKTPTTIDFAGHTVTYASAWRVLNHSELTLKDTVGNGGVKCDKGVVDNYGTLTVDGGSYTTANYDTGSVFYNNSGATAVINNCDIKANHFALYNDPNATMTVNGGNIVSVSDNTKGAWSYCVRNSGTFEMNGGLIQGVQGGIAACDNGTVTINDGKIVAANTNNNGQDFYALFVGDGNATVIVNGGELSGDSREAVWVNTAESVAIKGGTFTSTNKASAIMVSESAVETLAVTGGTFGSINVVNSDNKSVDVINSSNIIKNLSQLVKAVRTNGGEYLLGADIKVTGRISVNKDVTINGNGHTLTYTKDSGRMFKLNTPDVKIRLNNVILDGNFKDVTLISAYSDDGGNNTGNLIELTDCTVKNVKSSFYNVGAINQFGAAKGVYTNCKFENNVCTTDDETAYGNGGDIWAGAAADITIDGGTFTEVYGNADSGSAAKFTVKGNAVVKELVLGSASGHTASVTVEGKTATVEKLNVGTTEDVKLIMNKADLKDAAEKGGKCVLGKNITLSATVNIPTELEIIGGGHKITWFVFPDNPATMLKLSNENAKLTATDTIFNGNNNDVTLIYAYDGNGGQNPNNVITLNNCTVKNVNSSRKVGAICQFGSSKGIYNNCTFEKIKCDYVGEDKGADIWSGAAADVTINGGTYTQIYGNAGSGDAAAYTVNGNATIGEIALGSEPGHTATANIADTATVTKVNVGGKEAVLTADNKIVGTSGQFFSPDADDAFAGANPFTKSFELMGVQTKAEVANSLRFVSVISSDLLKAADDYGYIVGTTKLAKADAMANAGNITVEDYAKYKVSCVNTSNSVYEKYGDCNTDTNYKYVTAAVEGITDTSKTIFARVYVTVGDTTYYGDYINGTTYAGCATSLADLG